MSRRSNIPPMPDLTKMLEPDVIPVEVAPETAEVIEQHFDTYTEAETSQSVEEAPQLPDLDAVEMYHQSLMSARADIGTAYEDFRAYSDAYYFLCSLDETVDYPVGSHLNTMRFLIRQGDLNIDSVRDKMADGYARALRALKEYVDLANSFVDKLEAFYAGCDKNDKALYDLD